MAYTPKTWAQKMHNGKEPHLTTVEKQFADVVPGSRLLIASPLVVDAYIKHIPKGTHTSLQQMRKDLAAEYHADNTCPVTSGIFLRIVSENAYDEYMAGKPPAKITPFWRMIDSSAPICKKLSFGTEFVQQQRKKERLPF